MNKEASSCSLSSTNYSPSSDKLCFFPDRIETYSLPSRLCKSRAVSPKVFTFPSGASLVLPSNNPFLLSAIEFDYCKWLYLRTDHAELQKHQPIHWKPRFLSVFVAPLLLTFAATHATWQHCPHVVRYRPQHVFLFHISSIYLFYFHYHQPFCSHFRTEQYSTHAISTMNTNSIIFMTSPLRAHHYSGIIIARLVYKRFHKYLLVNFFLISSFSVCDEKRRNKIINYK